jgi:Nucleotidyltransferase domain
MEDAHLIALAERLQRVRGVVAVVLGGSRARGTHRPDSDYDVGLYYRGALDLAALGELAAGYGDAPVAVTAHGGWGPWMDGGGWFTVGGERVDWIYRDLDRVRRIWADCGQGRYEVGVQAGYALGFYSHTYAGELATCRVLSDPSGEVTALQPSTRQYPRALGDALVHGLWQAGFALAGVRKGAAAEDPTFAAGHLFHSVGVMCHALHGRAGVWLVHEKGMVASAARLALVPPGFADEAHALLAGVGRTQAEIAATADRAEAVLERVQAACGA